MDIVHLVVGLAVLTFGRKLFWIFVGVVGFFLGIQMATVYFGGLSQWMALVIALIAGLVGALLAIFFQRVAIVLAGFAAGGYIVASLSHISGLSAAPLQWIFFLVGGLAGAFLLYFLFDWTLIFLSSLTGASLITQSIRIDHFLTGVLFVGLFIAGFLIQSAMKKRAQKPA